jgi:hypothetical protein
MRFIPTRIHGVLDYTTALGLLGLPRAVGMRRDVGRLVAGAGIVTILYSILTRYELGLIRILPMKLHLTFDLASGAAFCASPWVIDVEDTRVRKVLLGVGLFEITVSLLSKTKPS